MFIIPPEQEQPKDSVSLDCFPEMEHVDKLPTPVSVTLQRNSGMNSKPSAPSVTNGPNDAGRIHCVF